MKSNWLSHTSGQLSVLSLAVLLSAPRLATATSFVQASGGDEKFVIVEDGTAYWVHKFKTAGSATFEVTAGGGVEYLLVGGGGGTGGNWTPTDNRPGGAGAGGFVLSNQTITATTYTITVGAGGAGTGFGGSGDDGGPSSAFGDTALGGGHSGNYMSDANSGGSGGGGGSTLSLTTLAGSGTPGQGHDGGVAFTNDTVCAGGGGGGAGDPGQHAYLDAGVIHGGDGGPGLSSDIDGTLRWYAGGGGGASYGGVGGSGGIGGGGQGQATTGSLGWMGAAYSGTANTGGGAGACRGASGGSGIVIVRYAIDPDAPFDIVTPFTLTNLETGSTEFTNTNEVNVSNLPDPIDAGMTYNRYQITESDDSSSIDPGEWKPFGEPLAQESFTMPVSDGTVTLYAWYTNATEAVQLQRASGEIVYTTIDPVPVAVDSVEFGTDGYTVRLTGVDLDAGSTSGDYAGSPIGIYRLVALDAEGQAANLTPDQLYFTAEGVGSYEVRLKVINMAGNAAYSGSLTLDVVAESLPVGAPGDLYVALGNLHADDQEPYGSWATAAPTIQDAVNAASNNATLWVAPAIYYGADNWVEPGAFANVVNIEKPVHLRGAVARERVIIDGFGLRRGLRIQHASAVVERFTLTNGYSTAGGGGVRIDNLGGTLRDCLVTGNRTEGADGGGIHASRAFAVIEGCDVIGNLAAPGSAGGVYLAGHLNDPGPQMRNSRILANNAPVYPASGGGVYAMLNVLIENCIIQNNRVSWTGDRGYSAGGMVVRGRVVVRNSLIAQNEKGSVGGKGSGINLVQATLILENSTVAHNDGWGVNDHQDPNYVYATNAIVFGNLDGDLNLDASPQVLRAVHSCAGSLANVTEGYGNITDNPLFVDPDAGNFRLRTGSPAINTGTNLPWMADALDLDGKRRIDGVSGLVDMGAYEYFSQATILLIR